MKARDFDEKFDAGADVSGDVDWAKARRPNLEARRLGVTRQALVKLWIVERLEKAAGADPGHCAS